MKFRRMSEVDLRGKRVFIRCDLNVPIEDGRIGDDTRIRASVPGIKHALAQGAAVMVTSHLGRPTEGELKPEDSLAPVAERLGSLLDTKIPLLCDVYVNDAFGTAHRAEATTHGVARYAKTACAGPLMSAELDALGKALANP